MHEYIWYKLLCKTVQKWQPTRCPLSALLGYSKWALVTVFIFSGLAKTKSRAKWLFKTLFVFYSCQWKSFWGTKGDESLWSGSICLHTTWQSLLPGSGHLNNIHCLFDSLFRHLFVHSLHPLFPQPRHQFLSCYLSLCLGSEALCCGSLQ